MRTCIPNVNLNPKAGLRLLFLAFIGLFSSQNLYAQYCAASASSCGISILNVTITGKFSNTSDSAANCLSSYTDFTAITADVAPQSTYDLAVVTDPYGGSFYQQVLVWADWNNDSIFSEDEAVVMAKDAAAIADLRVRFTGQLVVPPTAEIGLTRLRIRAFSADYDLGVVPEACGGSARGEVEDYTLNITTAPTSSGSPTYCASSSNCGAYAITKVAVTGDNGTSINNSSTTCAGYSDYTTLRVKMSVENGPYTLVVNCGATGSSNAIGSVFVDWDNNGTFDEAERVTAGYLLGAFTFNLTPSGTTSGLRRMRICSSNGAAIGQVTSPCGARNDDGETEDYTILFTAPLDTVPDCINSANATPANNAANICQSLTFKWNKVAQATDYVFSLYDGSVALVKDSTTKDTSFFFTSLTPGKTYKWIAIPAVNGTRAFACDTLTFSTSPNADPIADIIPATPATVCKNESLLLNGNPSLGTVAYTHKWNGSDNSTLSDVNTVAPTYTATESIGIHKYFYTVTDANGCRSTDSVEIETKAPGNAGTLTSAASPICAGSSTQLTVTNSVGTISWETALSSTGPWSSASLALISGTTYNTGVLSTTTYFRVIATNGTCIATGDPIEILVTQNPTKPIVTPLSATICSGKTVTLSVTNYSSDIVWNDASSTANVQLVVNTAGTYTASTTSLNCTSTSDPVVVVVNPTPATPTIQLTGSNPACVGQTIQLSSSSTVDNIWSTGASTQNISVTTAGVYSLTIKNSFGCESDPVQITVGFNPSPAKPIISANPTGEICEGDSVILTSSNVGSNIWNTGSTSDFITAKTAGNYRVTTTNANNCQSTSDDYTVVVKPKPAKPVITSNPSGQICDGDSVILSCSNVGSNLWTTGATTDAITVKTSGSYSVTTTGSNNCASTSDVITIVVNPLPAKPTITASGILCEGNTVELSSSVSGTNKWSTGSTQDMINITVDGNYSVTNTDSKGCSTESDIFIATFNPVPDRPMISQSGNVMTSSVTGATYQWFNENGPIAGATDITYEASVSGLYYVVVRSSAGCESERSMGHQFSGVGILTTTPSQRIQVFPNPSAGKFEVTLPSAVQSGSWTILDATGRIVTVGDFSKATLRIDEKLPKGIYILKVTANAFDYQERIQVY